jgi:hypothetical protein
MPTVARQRSVLSSQRTFSRAPALPCVAAIASSSLFNTICSQVFGIAPSPTLSVVSNSSCFVKRNSELMRRCPGCTFQISNYRFNLPTACYAQHFKKVSGWTSWSRSPVPTSSYTSVSTSSQINESGMCSSHLPLSSDTVTGTNIATTLYHPTHTYIYSCTPSYLFNQLSPSRSINHYTLWEWRHSNLWRRNEAECYSNEGALASGYIHKHAK